MEEPLTEELLDELRAAPSLSSYIDRHSLEGKTLAGYLNELLAAKGLARKDVVKAAGIGATFGYQIFTGARGASRDTLLPLAFAMGLSVRETNRLLKVAGTNELYPKVRRDVIVLYCLERGATLEEVDDALYSFGEKTLGPHGE